MGQGHIHDFNPGIAPSGLFWTTPIPAANVAFDLDQVRASLRLQGFAIPDSVPGLPATVSMDIEWSGKTAAVDVSDLVNGFAGRYSECLATIQWSAEETGFRFVSAPAAASKTKFAELGRERNGIFFSNG